MTRTPVLTALLILLVPSLAAADTLAVSGPNLAGSALVTRTAGDHVQVEVRTQTFGKKGAEQTLTGEGTWTRDELRWSYQEEVDPGFWRGVAGWLRDPFGRRPVAPTTKTIEVVLHRAGDAWQGEVAGAAQTWRAQGDTSDLVVLAIPGLSTNNWNEVGIPYLDENLDAMRARGLEARRLAIKTEDSVAANAEFIAREIRAEAARGKRVVIFAHSKGGTDTTAALALYPDLVPLVAGVVAIQPVYGGSPVADIVGSSRVLTGSVKLVFETVFKGSRDAVLDLQHDTRAAFVAAHPYPASQVPTVVIRSSFDRKFGSRSVLFPTQKLIAWRDHAASDGLVIPRDQVIPGAVATLDYRDLDHFEPGVRGESPHLPVDLTNAALDAMLPRLKPAAQASTAPAATAGRAFDRPLGE